MTLSLLWRVWSNYNCSCPLKRKPNHAILLFKVLQSLAHLACDFSWRESKIPIIVYSYWLTFLDFILLAHWCFTYFLISSWLQLTVVWTWQITYWLRIFELSIITLWNNHFHIIWNLTNSVIIVISGWLCNLLSSSPSWICKYQTQWETLY